MRRTGVKWGDMRDGTGSDADFSSDEQVDLPTSDHRLRTQQHLPLPRHVTGVVDNRASETKLPPHAGLPMLRDHPPATDSLRTLLLAIYRCPAKYPFWLDAETPLPPGIDVLIREALEVGNTSPVLGQGFPSPLPESAGQDDLIQAALFFVLHVMVTPGATHYRVMGLDHSASLREITERYQLLRRLLAVREGWPAVRESVERISRAYVVLRDRASRDTYDRTLLRGG